MLSLVHLFSFIIKSAFFVFIHFGNPVYFRDKQCFQTFQMPLATYYFLHFLSLAISQRDRWNKKYVCFYGPTIKMSSV